MWKDKEELLTDWVCQTSLSMRHEAKECVKITSLRKDKMMKMQVAVKQLMEFYSG